MRRCYKFRLYPTINQTRELEIMLETHRRLYNECLYYRSLSWEFYKVGITCDEQVKWLQQQRKQGHPYYTKLTAQSSNQTIKKLDDSFQAFFRRVKSGDKPGFPRYKGRDHYDTFGTGNYLNTTRLVGNRLRVKYIGDLKVKLHREIQGIIKTVSLTREAGKWYALFSCDLGEVGVVPSTNPPVGVDVGLESFLTTSDGEHRPNPRYQKKELPELRRRQRELSRKKPGGSNRRKAKAAVAKLHAKIKNLRRDHHYKEALNLVRRYGLVAVESLNIRGMMGNHRLARSIGDVAWGNFLIRLKNKAEEAGVQVVEVDPKGTSQTCSKCGEVVPKKLSQRWHDCPKCGLSLHRDENAARNILGRAAQQVRVGPAGRNGKGSSARAPRKSTTHGHIKRERSG